MRLLLLSATGLIGGSRSESRPLEALVTLLTRAVRPLLPKALRINPAERIASRLIEAALDAAPGCHVVGAGDLA